MDNCLADNSAEQIYGASKNMTDNWWINASFSFELRRHVEPTAHLLTLYEDLRDFGVAGAESAVDLKTVCIVEERASQREKDFLRKGQVTQPMIIQSLWVFQVLAALFFHRQTLYLELFHSFQLLQIWDQSCAVFQRLKKFDLEFHHFRQVPKQHIQLEAIKTTSLLFYTHPIIVSCHN